MSAERVRQPRRTRWQEYVVSKAFVLENERERLCRQECQNDPTTTYVKTATAGHLEAARQAIGVSGDGRTPVRLPRRDRLANAWTGAAVEGAFVNLHAAEVVLANLYSQQDISSRVPDVLARMRAAMPADDPRRVKAEALFGEQTGGAVPAGTARRRQGDGNGRPTDHDGDPGRLAERRAGLRDAMRVAYDAADELHARARSFRNVLIVSTVVLSLLVLAVCAVGAI